MTRPYVLLSNDDGVHAEGLLALREILLPVADVVVVAPAGEQSAKSHALTLNYPLRHKQIAPGIHAVDGTPADCIYVAIHHTSLLERKPDVVASGINHGLNLGSDVFYSGTVAAAREGALRGIPSLAFSLERGGDRKRASEIARDLVLKLAATSFHVERCPLINVNFPAGEILGVRTTILGKRVYNDDVLVRQDPRGQDYLWIGGDVKAHHELVIGSDTEAVDEHFASATPLVIDAMAYGERGFVEALVKDI